MRILVISDTFHGGAAVACRRLVQGLSARRASDCVWVAVHPRGDAIAHSLPQHKDLIENVIGKYAGRWHTRKRLSLRYQQRSAAKQLGEYASECASRIVNIHNIHQATDFSLLKYLPKNVPIIWTLHDMWPLTGYCCYSYACHKFMEGCQGECPQDGNWGRMTTKSPADGWKEREKHLHTLKGRLLFVAPSEWLAGMARKRFDDAFEVTCIPYGLDLDVFYLLSERGMLREFLGLPVTGKVILTGAHVANDPRKGAQFLKDAVVSLQSGRETPLHVVIFGDVNPNEPVPDNWHFTGRIEDERLLNLYYNAADVFVHPSLADNLPNTLVEATAAGLPSVTFDIGGCPEIVRHEKTGYVASYRDVEDLAKGIAWVLDRSDEVMSRLRTACRNVAIEEYDVALMAQRYSDLFKRRDARRSENE